ncbi:MAG: DNA topoisomerase I, partial [Microgenomates group bacterium Gr01-1014_93]
EIISKAEKIITDISKEFKIKEESIGKALLEGIEDVRKIERENNALNQCPTCKKGNLRILYSKKTQKYFVACSNYPECRQTFNLPPNSLIKKSGKDCESCKWPKLLAIRKAKRPWEFCFNPICPTRQERNNSDASEKKI